MTSKGLIRILVTGSRSWTDEVAIAQALHEAIIGSGVNSNRQVTVVTGACPKGADQIAETLAVEAKCHVERHPADWDRYGNQAGFRRNEEMVGLGADICLAFLGPCISEKCQRPKPHPSHGATHCAGLADQVKILTLRFEAWESDELSVNGP